MLRLPQHINRKEQCTTCMTSMLQSVPPLQPVEHRRALLALLLALPLRRLRSLCRLCRRRLRLPLHGRRLDPLDAAVQAQVDVLVELRVRRLGPECALADRARRTGVARARVRVERLAWYARRGRFAFAPRSGRRRLDRLVDLAQVQLRRWRPCGWLALFRT